MSLLDPKFGSTTVAKQLFVLKKRHCSSLQFESFSTLFLFFRFRTSVIARVVSLSAWACSALLMVPVFMYAATITKVSGGQNCNIFWPFDSDDEGDDGSATAAVDEERVNVLNGQTAFTFYSFVLGFAVPLALILVFYTLVIIKLKTVGPKNRSKEKKKSYRKVTRLVLTVITVYILCWLPYWITQLALIFTPPGHRQVRVELLGLLHSKVSL